MLHHSHENQRHPRGRFFVVQIFYLTNTPRGYKKAGMDDIQNRLRRLEGQVRGLQNLLKSPDDCEKIIIQFQAAKAALDTCFSKFLEQNLQKCLLVKNSEKMEKILKYLVKK